MAPRRLFILCLFVALWSMAQSVFATELRLATFNVAWLANKPLPSMSMVNLCQREARRYPELSRRPTPACRTGVFRGAGAYGLLARQVAALQADMIAFQEIEGSEALGRILADGHYQRVGEWRWWVNPLPVHARQRVAIAVRADKVAQMEITALPELGLPLSREARGGLLARWTLPSGETLWVLVVSVLLIVALYQFFERTLYGKALRATAINRVGAQLMGISPTLAGKLTFFLAAFIGALSGVLIAPITTIYYDTGFLIALKGFVAAIIGGLASYPLAAAGALVVGLLEAFASFWASAYKEVIVFTLIIPVLLWRSLRSHHVEEEE